MLREQPLRSEQLDECYSDAWAPESCLQPRRPFGYQNATPLRQKLRNVVKRSFDWLVAATGLIVSLPLCLVIGVLIKWEDGGPVLYSQERIGKDGSPFWSWKFRTMKADSDKRFGPMQARDGDSRITRFGRLLRATALDELPQLWNILKGDMSLVGPRALMPEEIEVYGGGRPVALKDVPGYVQRHSVRPGLTGIAQIYAPRDIPRVHKFEYDLMYIHDQSLWLDLKLILLSFFITFRGRWESRGAKL